ncbi:MAG: protein kinase, partial [Candidatus Binatia bacterium]
FLVLEMVEGETLAERLRKGALSAEEALDICTQITEALEAAHERGIIHRDLKPGNVKITPEGKVKVLDFGLAKAFEAAGSGERIGVDLSKSPTLTVDSSGSGIILGTAPYMSPEQARGKPLDKRTDIWSFGCVLFELLTNKRAFEGETISDTVAAILKGEPDWEALPEETPWSIRAMLRRCLQKDSHYRLRDIGDARIEIEEALRTPFDAMALTGEAQAVRSSWRRTVPWGITILMAAMVVFALWSPWSKTPLKPQSLRRFTISLPSKFVESSGPSMALSPDGHHFVYVGGTADQSEIYHHAMDQLGALPIKGTEDARRLFFSPDSKWVGFFAKGKLKKVSLLGGTSLIICDVGNTRGGCWGPDGNIIYSDFQSGLLRVSAAGGIPQRITIPEIEEGRETYRWPELLPGGKALLITVWKSGSSTYDEARIGVLSLESGELKTLLEGGSFPRYSPTGHLLFVRSGTLMAVPFDPAKLELQGVPAPILEDVKVGPGGGGHFTFSGDGLFFYLPAAGVGARRLVLVDREGKILQMIETKKQFVNPRFSPDGTHLAVTLIDYQGIDVWIYEISRGILTPFTFEKNNGWAIWTPDGNRLTFSSDRILGWNILWRPLDGSEVAEKFTDNKDFQIPASWSPGGVLAYQKGPVGNRDIWVLSLEGERKPKSFLATQFNERQPAFSPDGRRIAFTSDRSGQDEVYMMPYPGPGGIVPISKDGGVQPVWARNGKELFYRNGEKMIVVDIKEEPTFKIGMPRVLFEGSFVYDNPNWLWDYDVHPDGQRFVMIKASEEEVPFTHFNAVLNWFEELKRLAPRGK